jgi:hypothetical protein
LGSGLGCHTNRFRNLLKLIDYIRIHSLNQNRVIGFLFTFLLGTTIRSKIEAVLHLEEDLVGDPGLLDHPS